VDELWKSGKYSFRAAVRVGSSKTMRTRPCFDAWRTEFVAHFLPTVLDLDQVLEVFSIAGVLRGLGDWVPENGTFSVERLE